LLARPGRPQLACQPRRLPLHLRAVALYGLHVLLQDAGHFPQNLCQVGAREERFEGHQLHGHLIGLQQQLGLQPRGGRATGHVGRALLEGAACCDDAGGPCPPSFASAATAAGRARAPHPVDGFQLLQVDLEARDEALHCIHARRNAGFGVLRTQLGGGLCVGWVGGWWSDGAQRQIRSSPCNRRSLEGQWRGRWRRARTSAISRVNLSLRRASQSIELATGGLHRAVTRLPGGRRSNRDLPAIRCMSVTSLQYIFDMLTARHLGRDKRRNAGPARHLPGPHRIESRTDQHIASHCSDHAGRARAQRCQRVRAASIRGQAALRLQLQAQDQKPRWVGAVPRLRERRRAPACPQRLRPRALQSRQRSPPRRQRCGRTCRPPTEPSTCSGTWITCSRAPMARSWASSGAGGGGLCCAQPCCTLAVVR